ADELIEQCLAEADPLIRYGGAYAIGLAYCNTGKSSSSFFRVCPLFS
ncbi:hypothetical protein EMWEY_00029730, partial [Eimeria maxima]